MILIGLTGGIASGKTTVSSILKKKKNIIVIDADEVAKRALQEGQKPFLQLKNFFKTSYKSKFSDVFKTNEKAIEVIDRAQLGKLVFSDEKLRKYLNSITHRYVFIQVLKQVFYEYLSSTPFHTLFKASDAYNRIVILDVPLLFETKFFTYFTSKNVVVFCQPEQQIERLLKRNPELTRTDALARINSQMSSKARIEKGDFFIDNSADLGCLQKQIDEVILKIEKNSNHFLGWMFMAICGFVVLLIIILALFLFGF